MQGTVRKFKSFEDAERADRDYYRSLSPKERVDLLLDLVTQAQPADEAEQRFERVYRIVSLSEC